MSLTLGEKCIAAIRHQLEANNFVVSWDDEAKLIDDLLATEQPQLFWQKMSERKWVCENHPDKHWPDECDCGAGMLSATEQPQAKGEVWMDLSKGEKPQKGDRFWSPLTQSFWIVGDGCDHPAGWSENQFYQRRVTVPQEPDYWRIKACDTENQLQAELIAHAKTKTKLQELTTPQEQPPAGGEDNLQKGGDMRQIIHMAAVESWQKFKERIICGETFAKELEPVIQQACEFAAKAAVELHEANEKLRANWKGGDEPCRSTQELSASTAAEKSNPDPPQPADDLEAMAREVTAKIADIALNGTVAAIPDLAYYQVILAALRRATDGLRQEVAEQKAIAKEWFDSWGEVKSQLAAKEQELQKARLLLEEADRDIAARTKLQAATDRELEAKERECAELRESILLKGAECASGLTGDPEETVANVEHAWSAINECLTIGHERNDLANALTAQLEKAQEEVAEATKVMEEIRNTGDSSCIKPAWHKCTEAAEAFLAARLLQAGPKEES